MVEAPRKGLRNQITRLSRWVSDSLIQPPSQAEIAHALRITSSEEISPTEIERYRRNLMDRTSAAPALGVRGAEGINALDVQLISATQAHLDGIKNASPEAIEKRMRQEATATLERARARNLIL